MSGVKQSPWFRCCVFMTAGLLATQGCANSDLIRFAPPGIVKYEDIASQKPQNPAVAERISERRAEKGAGQFPDLSKEPGRDERPKSLPSEQVDAEIDALVDLREGLDEEVGADREAADAELAGDLQAEREALKARVERDSTDASRERREKLEPPAETK